MYEISGEVTVNVDIRNNESGEVRTYTTTQYLFYDEKIPSSHIWEDGNYSCDCNRYLFFERAGGNKPNLRITCSEGAFSVKVMLEDGTIIYNEID